MTISELANLVQTQLRSYQQTTRDNINKMSESLVSEMGKMKADIAANISNLREENAKTSADLAASIDNVKSTNV